MELTNARILIISLVVGVIIAAASGIPVRQNPVVSFAGADYGIGFPIAWSIQYCGVLGCGSWTSYPTLFIIDVILWFVFAAIIMFAARYAKSRKRRKTRA